MLKAVFFDLDGTLLLLNKDGECSYACGIKCYMVGDYLINHPKAKHTFIHISMNQVIDTIKREKDIKKE